ncbi:hypothetical protein LPJ64_001354 [Coemansia asiatica]|uniref:Uncharacterized protein n=1 Tax=Coemansia asiatica TaxID=1052880 RepID=A0A9W7XNN8_9FUNG|nr:hypothetical protein LPJ64_001354 [Coemansia asiatica]KAJ2887539.1 hypothetical protein FB639_001242 [Coemansia asiatica]
MVFKVTFYYAIAAIAAFSTLSLPVYVAANQSGCISSYDAKTDYFPDKVQVKYNPGFEISYKNNAKYVSNKISGETYVLYQCGSSIPDDAKATPADSLQVGGWTKLMAVPGTKVALDSAPASAIIEMLGLQDSVAGAYKFFTVTSACMQKRLAELPRVEQTYGTPNARRRRSNDRLGNSLVRRVSYDLAKDDLQWTFTTYGMSDPKSVAVNPENAADMLGKAEWIKFVAAFFNKEAEANKLFSQIENNYNSIKKTAPKTEKTVGIARYNKVANGTIVSWTIDQPQQWLVQGISDAGMKAHSGDTATFSDVNDFYKAVSAWDVLIDTSIEPLPHGGATIPQWENISNGYKFGSSKSAQSLPFVKANAIYRSDLISSYQNATDYNEHLQIQSDNLLGDLVKIAKTASGADDTKWYRNLPNKVSVDWISSSDCKN